MRNSHWLSDFLAKSGLNSDIVSEKMSQIQLDSIVRVWYTSTRSISGKITNFQVEKSEIDMASRVLSLVINSFSCMIDYFFSQSFITYTLLSGTLKVAIPRCTKQKIKSKMRLLYPDHQNVNPKTTSFVLSHYLAIKKANLGPSTIFNLQKSMNYAYDLWYYKDFSHDDIKIENR